MQKLAPSQTCNVMKENPIGRGPIGRTVAFETGNLQFESSHLRKTVDPF